MEEKAIEITIESLAKIISDRLNYIGTYISHLKCIQDISHYNSGFDNAFAGIQNALGCIIYMELFKLFDKDKRNYQYTIYALADRAKSNKNNFGQDASFHCIINKYEFEIESIRQRRNQIFGHQSSIPIEDLWINHPINKEWDGLEEMLQDFSKICHEINYECPTIVMTRTANDFKKWIKMAFTCLRRESALNEQLFKISVDREAFNNQLPAFLKTLHKQELQKYMKEQNLFNEESAQEIFSDRQEKFEKLIKDEE